MKMMSSPVPYDQQTALFFHVAFHICYRFASARAVVYLSSKEPLNALLSCYIQSIISLIGLCLLSVLKLFHTFQYGILIPYFLINTYDNIFI